MVADYQQGYANQTQDSVNRSLSLITA